MPKINKTKRKATQEKENFSARMKNAFEKDKKDFLFSMDDVLTFGKYRGQTIREIMQLDIEYLQWVILNHIFRLDPVAMVFFKSCVEEMHIKAAERERIRRETNEMRRKQRAEAEARSSQNSDSFNEFFQQQWQRKQQQQQQQRTYSQASSILQVDKAKLLPCYRFDGLSPRTRAGKLLRLSGKMTKEDIKAQYRKLALIFHPDKCEQLDEIFQEVARTMFVEIKAAYDYLEKEFSL